MGGGGGKWRFQKGESTHYVDCSCMFQYDRTCVVRAKMSGSLSCFFKNVREGGGGQMEVWICRREGARTLLGSNRRVKRKDS